MGNDDDDLLALAAIKSPLLSLFGVLAVGSGVSAAWYSGGENRKEIEAATRMRRRRGEKKKIQFRPLI